MLLALVFLNIKGKGNRGMSGKKNVVNIWCDGSYRQASNVAGAGWVIRQADGKEETRALTLPQLKDSFNYGSDVAELSAAANAMRAVPAGSDVLIHMDCKSAMEAIQTGKLSMKGREGAVSLRKAFDAAMEAKGRLGAVAFQLTSDRNNLNMSEAHRLSREATSPKPRKR